MGYEIICQVFIGAGAYFFTEIMNEIRVIESYFIQALAKSNCDIWLWKGKFLSKVRQFHERNCQGYGENPTVEEKDSE